MAGKVFEVAFRIAGQLDASLKSALASAQKSLLGVAKSAAVNKAAQKSSEVLKANLASYQNTSGEIAKYKEVLRGLSATQRETVAAVQNVSGAYAKHQEALSRAREAQTQFDAITNKKRQAEGRRDELRARTVRLRDEQNSLRMARLSTSDTREIARINEKLREIRKERAQVRIDTSQAQAALKGLTAAERLASNELKQFNSQAAASGNAFGSAQGKLAQLQATLSSQRSQLQALRSSLSSAGVSVNNLGSAESQLRSQIEHTNQALQRQQQVAQNQARLSDASAGMSNAWGSFQGAMSTAGAVANPFKDAIDNAKDFEYAMSNVKALTQMKNIRSGNLAKVEAEMSELTAEAERLGKTTEYTALEAAQAMGYLG